jgi:branched-subunit amino acid aminotransferase/4-amino-4-deoxychorismate lyase
MATRLLKSSEEILSAFSKARPKTTLELIALYSSRTNTLIESPGLIGIPISDSLLEGWGVFDTLNLYNKIPYQLDSHIDRLFFSASNSMMHLSFTKSSLKEKILEFISIFPSSRIRFFISGSDAFYILAYNDISQNKPESIKEVTVSVPIKPVFLSVIKTTNYLVNTLCVLEARTKGGYMGIFLDRQGFLAESAIANVAVVCDSCFLMPKDDNILEGTTAKRVFAFCQSLVEKGQLRFAGRQDISLEKVKECQEMMMLGGDSVIAIHQLNEKSFDPVPGPLTEKIQKFLNSDKSSYLSEL